jgi:hypothetical protein
MITTTTILPSILPNLYNPTPSFSPLLLISALVFSVPKPNPHYMVHPGLRQLAPK